MWDQDRVYIMQKSPEKKKTCDKDKGKKKRVPGLVHIAGLINEIIKPLVSLLSFHLPVA